MGRQLRVEYPEAHYHVTARGNERKEIFKSDRDREKFLDYLESAVVRYGAVIHAWCLMRNHYHLLVETPLGNLSQVMQHVNGAYTNYFNTKRKRSGHLFQGRYKAILVEADEYAVELSRYIHLNPVRVGAASDPSKYRWSSCPDYCGGRSPASWLKRGFILGYFGAAEIDAVAKYRRFVEDGIGTDSTSPLKRAVAGTILSSPDFVQRIQEEHADRMLQDRNLPSSRRFTAKVDIEQIVQSAGRALGDRRRQAEKVAVHLAHQYSGLKLRDVGAFFGMKDSAVTQASRRLADEMVTNTELRLVVESLKRELNL